jgi:hypothetical protein
MEKTVLKQLAEQLRKAAKITRHVDYQYGLEYAALCADNMLHNESLQIINAYDEGVHDGVVDGVNNVDGIKYYKETYES